jgi:hypothetical protein
MAPPFMNATGLATKILDKVIQAAQPERFTQDFLATKLGFGSGSANWKLFSDTFIDAKAVEGVLARLNMLRAPIAHCSMLAEDEVLRLRLSLRDWFQLME